KPRCWTPSFSGNKNVGRLWMKWPSHQPYETSACFVGSRSSPTFVSAFPKRNPFWYSHAWMNLTELNLSDPRYPLFLQERLGVGSTYTYRRGQSPDFVRTQDRAYSAPSADQAMPFSALMIALENSAMRCDRCQRISLSCRKGMPADSVARKAAGYYLPRSAFRQNPASVGLAPSS